MNSICKSQSLLYNWVEWYGILYLVLSKHMLWILFWSNLLFALFDKSLMFFIIQFRWKIYQNLTRKQQVTNKTVHSVAYWFLILLHLREQSINNSKQIVWQPFAQGLCNTKLAIQNFPEETYTLLKLNPKFNFKFSL